MTTEYDTRYWGLVSRSMDLEDQRLQLFVKHSGSLGTGREAILRRLFVEQTPEPNRVGTGFVAHMAADVVISAQCDVLVYNPTIHQPLYRIDEFVVVPPSCCRLAVEVKTNMDSSDDGLAQVFRVAGSMHSYFPTPVFGFGFDSPKFETLLSSLAQQITQLGESLSPECIAVHRKNFVCVRVAPKVAGPAGEPFYLGVDFALLGEDAAGYATALFMSCYHERIRHRAAFDPAIITIRARDLGVTAGQLKVITASGEIKTGFNPDRPLGQ